MLRGLHGCLDFAKSHPVILKKQNQQAAGGIHSSSHIPIISPCNTEIVQS